MKILFHISSLYGGGAERVMANLINNFKKEEHECILVICYAHDDEYKIDEGVKRYVIGDNNLLNQSISLRKIIKKENPDICLSFMEGGNIRMVIANLFSRQKYYLSVRNDPKREYRNIFTRLFAKIFFNLANGIIFQTKDAQKYFSKSIQKKSCIIPNPVDNNFFANYHDNENSRGIVTFGRLVAQKNFSYLIGSFNLIANEIEDNLYIYGEGPLKEKLQNQIESLGLNNRIFLMGRTNNTKEILEKSKLFVLSSKFEGMPNALLEAVCMLVPSISTDCPCGGPREVFKDFKEYLAPINDEKVFAKIMKNLILKTELRHKMIDYFKLIRVEYLIDNIFDQWELFLIKGGE